MLTERIKSSLKKLQLGQEIKKAKNLKKDLEIIDEKTDEIKTSVKTVLKQTKDTEELLGNANDHKATLLYSLHRLKEFAAEGKRDQALKEIQNIKSEVNAGKKELVSAWSDYRSTQYTSSAHLIASLASILDEDSRLDELGSLRMRIESKGIGNAQTIKDVDRFKMLTSQVLEAKGIDPEILDFILQLADGKELYLNQITPKAMSWMSEHRLDQKVKISL